MAGASAGARLPLHPQVLPGQEAPPHSESPEARPALGAASPFSPPSRGSASPYAALASALSCRGSARYDFSHEILRDDQSFFGERRVPRGRRISVICRSLPEGVRPGEPRQLPRTC